ncbi:hypothetical protein [Acinetobacter sp. BSP-28]|uniref:hypothetical protein n=1 Tax=Acinetobacter sp. BSP-28 TaxID=3344661 RepID=UPI0037700835
MAQKNSASNIAAIQKILDKISSKTVSFTQENLIAANTPNQNKAKLSILFQNGLARTTAGV